MAKEKQDLKPDTVLKNYWNNNDQFADLFNAVLFQSWNAADVSVLRLILGHTPSVCVPSQE